MVFPVTAIYAAILGLLIMVLALRVPLARRQKKVGLGDGGDKGLQQRIRVHANACEYVPLALVLFALLEGNGGAAGLLHAMGVMLVVGRLLHAWGLSTSRGVSFGRTVGTVLTIAVVVTLAAGNLAMVLR